VFAIMLRLLHSNKTFGRGVVQVAEVFCFNIRKFDHISYKYKEAGWMRLPERFLLHFGIFLFQLSKRQLPHYLYKKLIKHSDIHNRPTRYNDHFIVPAHSSALYQRSFSCSAARIYNLIPSEIKQSPSISVFKSKFKKYLFATPITL
jgi:hypothetical protein